MKRRKNKNVIEFKPGVEVKFSPEMTLRCDQSELYLTDEDMEKLNDRYEELYKKVKDSSHISIDQQKLEEYALLQKYAFMVVELSRKRRKEYFEAQAKIEADESYIIPARKTRFLWLRRLFRRPTQNRAQDIIDFEADLNAEDYFRQREAENEQHAKSLEQAGTPETSEQPGAPDTPADVPEQPGTAEQPVEEPKKRRRRRASTQATAELNGIRQEADDVQTPTPTSSDTTPPAQLPGQINIEDIK